MNPATEWQLVQNELEAILELPNRTSWSEARESRYDDLCTREQWLIRARMPQH
jgi:hypothetical protein